MSNHGDHRIHRTGEYVRDETIWTDDEVELVGWLLTDGSYASYKSADDGQPMQIILYQSHRAKPRNVSQISDLFSRLGFPNKGISQKENGLTRWTASGALPQKLIRLFPKRTLTPQFLSELSSEQCFILMDTMLLGDGSSSLKVSFTASSKEKSDMFQMLCCLCGAATTAKYRDMSMYSPKSPLMKNIPKMTGVWVVTLLKRGTVQICRAHKNEHSASNGVWCPTLPSTYFIARRKGGVYITGNTPDQGSVSDVIKIAMRNIYNEWESRGVLYDWYTQTGKVKMLSQVHDELIFEATEEFVEEAAADVQRHMEHAVKLRAPMTAVPGIGDNWNSAKKDGKKREKAYVRSVAK
jgi:hypothetical protein